MNYHTQIHTFKTADNERLHGALLTPPHGASDLGLIFVHGPAMNFYLPPLFNFGQALAQRGYHSFVIIPAAMTGSRGRGICRNLAALPMRIWKTA